VFRFNTFVRVVDVCRLFEFLNNLLVVSENHRFSTTIKYNKISDEKGRECVLHWTDD
jgi:hypothetical protein